MKIILILWRKGDTCSMPPQPTLNKFQNLFLDFFPRKAIQEKQEHFNIVLSGLVKEE